MSSDSEDDCYGNVTARLQKMKDKFDEDKTETMNLLDDSSELDAIVKSCPLPPKTTKNTRRKTAGNTNDTPDELPDVSMGNVAGNTNKRATRSSVRKNQSEPPVEAELPPARAKRKNNDDTGATAGANESVTRGRGSSTRRGRGGRGRGRGRGRATPRRRSRGWMWLPRFGRHDFLADFFDAIIPNLNSSSSMPVYSVGNTDEYPDQSDSQALFGAKEKKDDVLLVEDNDELDDNEELSVKVYWQNSEFFKFTIRKFQKFTQMFDYFTKKENIAEDKLLFTYNDKILKPDDTPDSIGYSIVKFIDGGIVTQGVKNLTTREENIKDGIKLKFQCQNLKKPFEITIRLEDKMLLAMMKCSEHLELPLEKLRFEFDGDSISGKCTAKDMEFEGGECIDVRILS